MIRRFFYYFFWNLYDYLGSYFVLGAATGLLVLLSTTVLAYVGSHIAPGIPQLFALIVFAFIELLLMAASFAGFFFFATRAARDEPARMPHFLKGIRELFWPYFRMLLVAALALAVIAANVFFYIRFAGSVKTDGARMAMFSLGMVFMWLGICAIVYMHALLSMPARYQEERGVIKLLKKGFITFILVPGFWFFVAVFHLLLVSLLSISVVGVFFLLPVFASLSTTASHIALQHLDFLRQAREELGESRQIGEYKRRAAQLAEEWQARQPHRTFRELIKPWEN